MRFINHLSYALENLFWEETGVSFMEFALIGLLVMIVSMLALLAWNKTA